MIQEVPDERSEAQENVVCQNEPINLNITIESSNLNDIECQYLEGKIYWV